jgi:quinolinate synthase
VNTTAATKAVTDVVVTSSNARQIVESFPPETPIIFGPDQNLGGYINSITGRNMVLWNGACHVHARFSVEKIVELKREHPHAKMLVHPECKGPVVKLADKVGSTAALLKFAIADEATEFIVATESGILHEMQKKAPQKTFIPAPPEEAMVETPEGKRSCACNECEYMKMVTLEKVYRCLRDEQPVVTVSPEIAEKAIRPIKRMLDISAQLNL